MENNKESIVRIRPLWKNRGGGWNRVLPTKADLNLQLNTILHTEMVINLGSSMVFDYIVHEKPCAYINYDVPNKVRNSWSVDKIYKYVHFRSMPSKKAVLWINQSSDIERHIANVLSNTTFDYSLEVTKEWFSTINKLPAEKASQRIWETIHEILE